ncbi:MAG: hypothetical protein NTZ73_01265 [Candidatus Diapherotrites archaeon]|nr:hypothetical protein [Candidatus Diapherotrites archaeon]
MLSFILSKMNMLLFATGIFVIALAFMNFIEYRDMTVAATNLLQKNALTIQQQIEQEGMCSTKSVGIPDYLRYGLKESILYEINFTKVQIFEGSANVPKKNELVLSINKRKSKTVIASQSVVTDAEIILVGPDVSTERRNLSAADYGLDSITIFSRAEIPMDAYAIVKEVSNKNKTIYIIPCTSSINMDCELAVLKVGCYKINSSGQNPAPNTPISGCFVNSLLEDEAVQKANNFQKCIDRGLVG